MVVFWSASHGLEIMLGPLLTQNKTVIHAEELQKVLPWSYRDYLAKHFGHV